MARFAKAGGEVTVLTVAAHMPPLYPQRVHEITIAEAREAHALVAVKDSIFLNHPAVLLGQIPIPEFNSGILNVVKAVEPDVLLVPYPDRHVDHRMIFEACMVAARPIGAGLSIKTLAAYETLSETHWNAAHIEPNFTPNWCVDITDNIDIKIEAMRCYRSQSQCFPMPRSVEALRALALFRGSQAGFAYGEGFHLLRMTMPPEKLL
jgi:LmbE family N-acetylglucosaminyl deacetylase